MWKGAQVQGLKESRPTIRGDEDCGLVSFEEVWTSLHHLASQSAMFRNDLYNALEGTSTRPIVLSSSIQYNCGTHYSTVEILSE